MTDRGPAFILRYAPNIRPLQSGVSEVRLEIAAAYSRSGQKHQGCRVADVAADLPLGVGQLARVHVGLR